MKKYQTIQVNKPIWRDLQEIKSKHKLSYNELFIILVNIVNKNSELIKVEMSKLGIKHNYKQNRKKRVRKKVK